MKIMNGMKTYFLQKNMNDGQSSNKILAIRNQEIDSKLAYTLSKVTKKAFVRSPLTCETSQFVCQLCLQGFLILFQNYWKTRFH